MPIQDKLKTNPELIDINNKVANALDNLIERKWGTVIITFSCQSGRIKTYKINDEQVFVYKNEPDKE